MGRISVVAGAFLWGTLALFVKKLSSFGFSEMEIVAIRVTGACLCLIPFVFSVYGIGGLRWRMRHIWYFIGTGLFSIVFFNWAYFTAMNIMSISLAVMLLYTGPAFVAILSALFLKEKMTWRKALAILMTVTGSAVIAISGNGTTGQLSALGLIIGLGSGFGYALYSIFSKLASKHYDSMTITFYTFLISALCLLPFFPFWKKAAALPLEAWLFMAGLGLFPTVIAYLLYTYGLMQVETSTASILATIEPIAALMIAVLLFHEQLYGGQLAGTVLILSSIFVISYEKKQRDRLAA
ncbi:DMT family transporter [Siminovitchia sediminis]|uniref:DMT family transporter n=1 Tax=Siminovitchia sediminis TaxID=1274353 RepID=A0ABW4KI41_9BACI